MSQRPISAGCRAKERGLLYMRNEHIKIIMRRNLFLPSYMYSLQHPMILFFDKTVMIRLQECIHVSWSQPSLYILIKNFISLGMVHTWYDAQRTKRVIMQSANNAGPDQPARMRRLIGAFVVRLMDAVVYFDEQRMFRLDCTDAHAHLDLRCSQMA